MGRRKKTRAATEESLDLPEEIIEHILVRLPVKSLSRFRCVSKSWLCLIDSKRFVQRHLQYSTKTSDSAHERVIMYNLCKKYKAKQYSLRRLLEEPLGTHLSPLGHPISLKPDLLACCCNGLLCIYQDFVMHRGQRLLHIYPQRRRFLLLNPTTGVSKKLPKDPEIDFSGRLSMLRFGFGWDESSGAYKVFVNWKPMGLKSVGRVYSSKTNSWKTVEGSHLRSYQDGELMGLYHQEGKFIGGNIHWLSTNLREINSFDVKSDVFGTIELPNQTKYRHWEDLGVVEGFLCIFYRVYKPPEIAYDVWVMKESWEKLPTIHLPYKPYAITGYLKVIGAVNGEILIAHKGVYMFTAP